MKKRKPLATAWVAEAVGATGKEATDMKNTWFKEHLTDGKSSLPFSFTYDGQLSANLLTAWPVKIASERLDEERSGVNVEGEIALPAGG